MDNLKKIFWILFAVIMLLSFPVSFYFLGKAFLSYLNAVDKTVAASIIAASGTVITAVLTVVISQYIGKKRVIEDAHRERKSILYSKFIDFTINWVHTHDKKRSPKEEEKHTRELEKFLINFSKDLMLWASPSVIKAWESFRNNDFEKSDVNTLVLVDTIYSAMRKDLGNSNFGLTSGTLVNLFIRQDGK